MFIAQAYRTVAEQSRAEQRKGWEGMGQSMRASQRLLMARPRAHAYACMRACVCGWVGRQGCGWDGAPLTYVKSDEEISNVLELDARGNLFLEGGPDVLEPHRGAEYKPG